MKRTLPWIVGGVGVAVGLLLLGRHRDTATAVAEQFSKQAAQPSASSGASSAQDTPAAPEGKIVHTFEDEAKMKEFANLWQQRQAILVRMTVLQAYWEQEQATLTQVNSRLVADYQLDVTKNYVMDSQRRVLIEREAPPAAPQPVATAPPPTQPSGNQ